MSTPSNDPTTIPTFRDALAGAKVLADMAGVAKAGAEQAEGAANTTKSAIDEIYSDIQSRQSTIHIDADNAQSALASFKARYLGVFDSDPDVDGNGDPLTVGALYFNSLTGRMNVYEGSGWFVLTNLILSTTGAPDPSLGNNGDYAIDGSGGAIYGPKADGAWPAGTSLIGPIPDHQWDGTQLRFQLPDGWGPYTDLRGPAPEHQWTGTSLQFMLPNGDWGSAVDLKGGTGDDGTNGWTPVEALVADGDRVVKRIVDWVGGTGTQPATGKYVGESGFVDDIGDGVDVRGAPGAGGGDAVGPASSVAGNLAAFDGTDGKLFKDSGLSVDADGALAANSDAKLATQKAVKTYVDTGLAAKASTSYVDGGLAGKASTSYVDGRVDTLTTWLRWSELQKATNIAIWPDGYADGYGDASNINTGSSSNYEVDGGVLRPTRSSGAGLNVATSGQAISGGDNGANVKGNAFDGSTSTLWYSSQLSGAVSGTAYIGQDFGATPRSIRRIVYTNTNSGYAITSVKAEYSDDNSTWTTVLTQTVSATTNATNTIDLPESGKHRYWRLLANANPTNNWGISECTMLLAAPNNMTVIEAAIASSIGVPAKANVLVLLAPAELSAAPTINTDLIVSVSRNGGTTYTAVTLSLSATLPDGTKLYEGSATFGGASGSSMVLKMVSANNKDARIAAIAYQWSV